MNNAKVIFVDMSAEVEVKDLDDGTAPLRMKDVTQPGDGEQVNALCDLVAGSLSFSGTMAHAKPMSLESRVRAGGTFKLRIIFPNGEEKSGEIVIASIKKKASSSTLSIAVNGMFTGEVKRAGSSTETPRTVGHRIDLHEGSRVTIGYQDSRQDVVIRPWFRDGLADTRTKLRDALDSVVKKEGGYTHKAPGTTNLYLLSGTGDSFGRTQAAGALVYGHGPRSCMPAAPSVTVGFKVVRSRVTQSVGGSAAGGEACAGMSIITTIKREVVVLQYRFPGVWLSLPDQPAMTGAISNTAVTIFGKTFASFNFRFLGLDHVPYQTPAGIIYVGSLRYEYNPAGYKAGSLTCIYYTARPLEGNQTQPGYILNAAFVQYYEHDTATFDDLATLCPVCYGEDA